MEKALVVIPARYESQRLPGKVLLEVQRKPLLQYVYENASKAHRADKVLIATDSKKVEDRALGFGAEVMFTSPDHTSGTERVAEVARKFADYSLVVNLQGDEPEMPPSYLDRLIDFLSRDTSLSMVTLAAPITDREEVESPNNVKVVMDQKNRALYFSRALVPFPRKEPSCYYRHIGIYGFRRAFLLELVSLAPTPLEKAESLEQLRALENGYSIGVELVDFIPAGIDTEDEFLAFKNRVLEG